MEPVPPAAGPVIGISGPNRSGKSTFALELAEAFWAWGVGARVLSFAAAARDATEQIYDQLSPVSLTLDKDKIHPFYGVTPRELLIQVAESAKRYDPDVWVRHAERLQRDRYIRVIIFDDVRFGCELDWILRSGGVVYDMVQGKPPIEEIVEDALTRWPAIR